MFTPLGLFGAISCPQGQDCTLLKCIFSHDNEPAPDEAPISKIPASADDGPPSKRVKVGNTQLPGPTFPSHSSKESSLEMERRSSKPVASKQSHNSRDTSGTQDIPQPTSSHGPPKPLGNEPVKSTNTTSAGSSSRLPPRKAPKETLNPRMLAHAPATHGSRTAILQKLHSAMTALNEKLRKDKHSSNRCFVLTPDELITMALDEEEKFARDSPSVYSNVIKLRIVKVTKMGIDEWTKEVMSHLNARYYKINPIQKPQAIPMPINTGLTPAEEIAVVSQLVTPLAGLEQHGYVTKPPTNADIEIAKRGVDESKGWEKIDAVNGSRYFQVVAKMVPWPAVAAVTIIQDGPFTLSARKQTMSPVPPSHTSPAAAKHWDRLPAAPEPRHMCSRSRRPSDLHPSSNSKQPHLSQGKDPWNRSLLIARWATQRWVSN